MFAIWQSSCRSKYDCQCHLGVRVTQSICKHLRIFDVPVPLNGTVRLCHKAINHLFALEVMQHESHYVTIPITTVDNGRNHNGHELQAHLLEEWVRFVQITRQ